LVPGAEAAPLAGALDRSRRYDGLLLVLLVVGAGGRVLAGREAEAFTELGQLLPDGEYRRGGVGVRDGQGERGGLHRLDRVLDGGRAPAGRSAGGVVQLARRPTRVPSRRGACSTHLVLQSQLEGLASAFVVAEASAGLAESSPP
jgi:hypothetical protein